MSFLLRAALVIGALSYLASVRGQTGTAPTGIAAIASAVADTAVVPVGIGDVPRVWNAISPDTRQRLGRDVMAELVRRTAPAASGDTLAEADRRAPWRGTEPR